ncbi:carboxypeptidase regulatory-like domain-containing protein [Streptomyces sp. NBC_00006]|uniref:MSCRAMM family protein n=1 Tax=Streptomyces sp. NBC_00006 TaxID=2975619 RepID=UPI00225A8D28|nr:carboxypeptidase-like regulatory domain-containing protein [Streptomyces sp. NBC_00006]MCX5537386.1 carboxypeptidase regulatory-like domain-containing protein [Streptomyces sp. NBC_00006]
MQGGAVPHPSEPERELVTASVGAQGAAQPQKHLATASAAEVGGGERSFAPSGNGILGAVRTGGGEAVARAAITLISTGGRQISRSVTDSGGAYSLDVPGAGTYVLIVAADGHQPQASTVTVDGELLSHDIVLTGTGGLAGLVRESGGRPVPEALVVVTDVRGEVVATARTGLHGDFACGGLVNGMFTLAVNAPGFRPTAQQVETGAQGVTQVELVLGVGKRVQGVVRAGTDDGPLADARVTLVDAAGNVIATTTTGPDGAYAFTDLDAGDYSVIATGYPPAAQTLRVGDAEPGDLDIRLRHPEA